MKKKTNFNAPPSLFYFRGNTDVILFLLQKKIKGGKVSQFLPHLELTRNFFIPIWAA